MRITLAVVGRSRSGPARDLYDLYASRLTWPLVLREVEEKRPLKGKQLMDRESELLLAALPADGAVIALDESGENLSSAKFAAMVGRYRDQGCADLAFVIGGADGLGPRIKKRADRLIAFGAATWPHLLVRALLLEQLYRAQSILTGHPYHRA